MNKNRQLVSCIQQRINEDKPLIQVVVGPRQVGKTTALQSALAGKGVYKSADSPVPLNAEVLREWWDEAAKCEDRLLAVDEIQKVTNWAEAVKQLWDQSEGMKLVLTGSSALLVEKGLSETLAGRFELIRAEHWNLREAQETFGMSTRDFIEFGCYPGAAPFLNDVSRWSAYVRDSIVEPALGRDLLQLHPVDSPSLLRQVFGVAVSLPAQIVSLNKVQGELQGRGTIPTIKTYLHLLSQAFLVSGVEKYSASTFRSRKSIPKLVVHDNALVKAFERPVTASIEAERFGHYFENVVGARFIEAGWETYYWKHRNYEADYVVLGPGGECYAVEVKSGETTLAALKGAFEFCKLNKSFEPRLISLVGQRVDGIESLDAEEVLSLSRLSSKVL